jgi:hypothetical protein
MALRNHMSISLRCDMKLQITGKRRIGACLQLPGVNREAHDRSVSILAGGSQPLLAENDRRAIRLLNEQEH